MDKKIANLYDAGKVDDAIHLLIKKINNHPKNIENYLQLSTYLIEQNSADQALELLEKARGLVDQPEALTYNIAVCYYMQGDFAKSLALLNSIPDDEETMYQKSLIFMKLGQYQKALAYALTLKNQDERTLELIGDIWLSLGDLKSANQTYSKILKDKRNAAEDAQNGKATVFGYYVNDPERFGVVDFDKNGNAVSIEEKPEHPKSNYAVTGLYFYPAGVSKKAAQVKPSARGEVEITSLNDMYLQDGDLGVQLLGRGYAWLDTGTMQSLVDAANYVKTIQDRQGITFSAPEEIAYVHGWIDKDQLLEAAKHYGKSPYGKHLKSVAEGKVRY